MGMAFCAPLSCSASCSDDASRRRSGTTCAEYKDPSLWTCTGVFTNSECAGTPCSHASEAVNSRRRNTVARASCDGNEHCSEAAETCQATCDACEDSSSGECGGGCVAGIIIMILFCFCCCGGCCLWQNPQLRRQLEAQLQPSTQAAPHATAMGKQVTQEATVVGVVDQVAPANGQKAGERTQTPTCTV